MNPWKKRAMFFIPLMFLGVFAMAGLIMFLWNWLMPNLFHLSNISFWQAMGLFVLSRILFGGFNFNKGGRFKKKNPAFKENFMNMTAEEKQAFKDQWKQRCR